MTILLGLTVIACFVLPFIISQSIGPGVDLHEVSADVLEFRRGVGEQNTEYDYNRTSSMGTFYLLEAKARLSVEVVKKPWQQLISTHEVQLMLEYLGDQIRTLSTPVSMTMLVRRKNSVRWSAWAGSCWIGVVIELLTSAELAHSKPASSDSRQVTGF